MKLYNKFFILFLSLGMFFISCEKEEFYDDNGSTDVTNIQSNATGEFFYDFTSNQSVTIDIDAGSLGSTGSPMLKKRINAGEWLDHGTVSVPSSLTLSLDDVFDGTSWTLSDVSAGDVIEFAYSIDGGTFLNGHTVVPITCSTDLSMSDLSSEVFSPVDGINGKISFYLEIVGPATIDDVVFTSTYMSEGSVSAPVSVILPSTLLPDTITVNLSDLLTSHGINFSDLKIADLFEFSFVLESSVSCVSSLSLSIPYGCPSNLAGTFDYVSTNYFCTGDDIEGTATWTATGTPGVYSIDDWGYGTYAACYGGAAANWGTLELVDICDQLSIVGVDNYGDTWSLTVDAVNGADLTYTWSNTYGESGTVTLTRTDGTEWPPNLYN